MEIVFFKYTPNRLCHIFTQCLQSAAQRQKTGAQFPLFTQISEPKEGSYNCCTGEYSARKYLLVCFSSPVDVVPLHIEY